MHRLLTAVLLMALSATAWPHALSNAFLHLDLDGGQLQGSLALRLEDVALIAPLDSDRDGAITWGEVKGARAPIDAYVQRNLQLHSESGVCAWAIGAHQVDDLTSGRFLHIPLSGSCPVPATALTVYYHLLFGLLPSHRSFLQVNSRETAFPTVLSPEHPSVTVTPGHEVNAGTVLLNFLWQGMLHIWKGYDHLAFLFALILPLFVKRRAATAADGSPRRILVDLVRVVTAFTLAHTLTLILASTLSLAFNPVWIEIMIAVTVVLSGINMVYPIFGHAVWPMAFAFGLIHGFGFANVLRDLVLSGTYFFTGLLSFNAGVELGQLLIVALVLPLLFGLRRHAFYGRLIVPAAAVCITGMGLGWTLVRVLGI